MKSSCTLLSAVLVGLQLLQVAQAIDLTPRAPENHPAGHLFRAQRRQTNSVAVGAISGNGLPYPEPGTEPPKDIPQEWIDAYNAAKAAGKIPDIQPSTLDTNTGLNVYPSSQPMADVCSYTVQKCQTDDIWLAPPGMAGITMDDGPVPASPSLVEYLQEKNQGSTHFVIGTAIMYNPDAFAVMAAATSPPLHFACHTFTHSLQTTKTDLEVLSDLGWNMQLILDVTGKVPMYWRAPQGDVDSRVRAIAREVLGLQHVMWAEDRDADDWCLRQGSGTAEFVDSCKNGIGKSYASVVKEQVSWASSNKNTGYIGLEHETTDQSINAFKEYQQALVANNWKAVAIPDLQGLPWYQNQYGPNDTVERAKSILPVRAPFLVVDSSAPAGSAGAPDTSAFNDLKGGSTGSSSSSSRTSTTTKSSSRSTTSSTRAPTQSGSAATTGSNGAVLSAGVGLVGLAIPAVAMLVAW